MPVRIDRQKCDNCGRCLERCGMDVYVRSADGTVFPRYPRKCVDCTLCVSGCPLHAISMIFPHAGSLPATSGEACHAH